ADAVFAARSQELMMRVVNAYLDTLAAGDQLRLIIAQRDALAEMQDVNRRRFDKGEGTRTEVLETKARAELAQAQVVEAQDALDAAMRKLRAIIGRDIDTLRTLPRTMAMLPLVPNRIAEWEALATENTPAQARSDRLAQPNHVGFRTDLQPADDHQFRRHSVQPADLLRRRHLGQRAARCGSVEQIQSRSG
ncbi:MAG: hypothetical protein EBV64_14630, partial [Oxalobacteraceae bacterium]|nr:hypothetical protein [Oxalobacteraceae bacterium]